MIGTRRPVTVAFVATAFVILVVVVLWVVPGYLVSRCPVSTTVGGRWYCSEPISLTSSPPCTYGPYCSIAPHPPTFLWWGFAFELGYGRSPDGVSGLGGHVTEPNGHSFTFYLQGDPLGPAVMNWSSTDAAVFVTWHAPFATNESDGEFGTTVVCGVLFAMLTGA